MKEGRRGRIRSDIGDIYNGQKGLVSKKIASCAMHSKGRVRDSAQFSVVALIQAAQSCPFAIDDGTLHLPL